MRSFEAFIFILLFCVDYGGRLSFAAAVLVVDPVMLLCFPVASCILASCSFYLWAIFDGEAPPLPPRPEGSCEELLFWHFSGEMRPNVGLTNERSDCFIVFDVKKDIRLFK